jgi:hypothetical protein
MTRNIADEVGSFGWREVLDKTAERFPQCVDGSQRLGTQHSFFIPVTQSLLARLNPALANGHPPRK